eukprot:TRINITY_DN8216_c0_g1_i1.p1 TRINITY_DN8216_c0_g1~~TRINITY_DN8216_c0_g1_i1.p1  ORF type:complete len:1593 (+),score=390.99 TRINITY_DN8216_c0_g1_i1:90-4868(+)
MVQQAEARPLSSSLLGVPTRERPRRSQGSPAVSPLLPAVTTPSGPPLQPPSRGPAPVPSFRRTGQRGANAPAAAAAGAAAASPRAAASRSAATTASQSKAHEPPSTEAQRQLLAERKHEMIREHVTRMAQDIGSFEEEIESEAELEAEQAARGRLDTEAAFDQKLQQRRDREAILVSPSALTAEGDRTRRALREELGLWAEQVIAREDDDFDHKRALGPTWSEMAERLREISSEHRTLRQGHGKLIAGELQSSHRRLADYCAQSLKLLAQQTRGKADAEMRAERLQARAAALTEMLEELPVEDLQESLERKDELIRVLQRREAVTVGRVRAQLARLQDARDGNAELVTELQQENTSLHHKLAQASEAVSKASAVQDSAERRIREQVAQRERELLEQFRAQPPEVVTEVVYKERAKPVMKEALTQTSVLWAERDAQTPNPRWGRDGDLRWERTAEDPGSPPPTPEHEVRQRERDLLLHRSGHAVGAMRRLAARRRHGLYCAQRLIALLLRVRARIAERRFQKETKALADRLGTAELQASEARQAMVALQSMVKSGAFQSLDSAARKEVEAAERALKEEKTARLEVQRRLAEREQEAETYVPARAITELYRSAQALATAAAESIAAMRAAVYTASGRGLRHVRSELASIANAALRAMRRDTAAVAQRAFTYLLTRFPQESEIAGIAMSPGRWFTPASPRAAAGAPRGPTGGAATRLASRRQSSAASLPDPGLRVALPGVLCDSPEGVRPRLQAFVQALDAQDATPLVTTAHDMATAFDECNYFLASLGDCAADRLRPDTPELEVAATESQTEPPATADAAVECTLAVSSEAAQSSSRAPSLRGSSSEWDNAGAGVELPDSQPLYQAPPQGASRSGSRTHQYTSSVSALSTSGEPTPSQRGARSGRLLASSSAASMQPRSPSAVSAVAVGSVHDGGSFGPHAGVHLETPYAQPAQAAVSLASGVGPRGTSAASLSAHSPASRPVSMVRSAQRSQRQDSGRPSGTGTVSEPSAPRSAEDGSLSPPTPSSTTTPEAPPTETDPDHAQEAGWGARCPHCGEWLQWPSTAVPPQLDATAVPPQLDAGGSLPTQTASTQFIASVSSSAHQEETASAARQQGQRQAGAAAAPRPSPPAVPASSTSAASSAASQPLSSREQTPPAAAPPSTADAATDTADLVRQAEQHGGSFLLRVDGSAFGAPGTRTPRRSTARTAGCFPTPAPRVSFAEGLPNSPAWRPAVSPTSERGSRASIRIPDGVRTPRTEPSHPESPPQQQDELLREQVAGAMRTAVARARLATLHREPARKRYRWSHIEQLAQKEAAAIAEGCARQAKLRGDRAAGRVLAQGCPQSPKGRLPAAAAPRAAPLVEDEDAVDHRFALLPNNAKLHAPAAGGSPKWTDMLPVRVNPRSVHPPRSAERGFGDAARLEALLAALDKGGGRQLSPRARRTGLTTADRRQLLRALALPLHMHARLLGREEAPQTGALPAPPTRQRQRPTSAGQAERSARAQAPVAARLAGICVAAQLPTAPPPQQRARPLSASATRRVHFGDSAQPRQGATMAVVADSRLQSAPQRHWVVPVPPPRQETPSSGYITPQLAA